MISALRPSRFMPAGHNRIDVSFEFFPPKDEAMEQTLWESVTRLAPLSPEFVSVTYGAGGTTRERTHATVKRILTETDLTPAAHLTCVAATRDEVDAIVRNYHDAGVRHIVALRGDSVAGPGTKYAPHPGGYDNLGRSRRRHQAHQFRFRSVGVGLSGTPSRIRRRSKPISTCSKRKVDAGATRAMTQFFFENDLYFRYLDRVRARGIDIPIVPGILPVQNFKAATNFAARAGASVPAWLAERFAGLDDDPATRKLIAAAVAAEQAHRSAGSRRHQFPFLHHEPRRPRLRDLPSAGLAAGGGAGRLIISELPFTVNASKTTHKPDIRANSPPP